MALTEEERHLLFDKLRETLGPKDAGRMMEMLPPTGWADVARKDDLLALQADVDRRFEEVHRRFDDLPRIFATKDDLRDQTRFFVGAMVANNAVLIAAIALIIGLAR